MVLVAIPFLAFAAAFVLAGLSQTFNAQHGQDAGGFMGFLNTIVQNSIPAKILGLGNRAARYVISRFAAARFRELTGYLHGMARLWKAEFRAMRAQADAATGAAQALERAIPIEAKKAAAPAFNLGRLNARQLSRFRAEVKPAIKHLTVAVDVTLPQQLGRIRARERAVEKDVAGLRERTGLIESGALKVWDWLRSHPLSAAMGAFASVTSIALSQLGLDWLNCRSNPFRKSKNPCGLWGDLSELLGLATLAVGALEFDTLIREAQTLTEDATKAFEDVFGISG